MTRITGLACFFLVALRLAIGWHFVVEGAHKIETHRIGKTATNTPWTGEAFFREGSGPAAPYFREYLHLDDRDALARLKSENHVLPTVVNNEWDDYFQRFVSHFELTEQQKMAAGDKLAEGKKKTADWLAGDVPTEVKKTLVWGTETVKQTVPQRLGEYEAKAKEVTDALERRLPAFNRDVEKSRLRTLKTEASTVLTGLLNDLDARTADMKRSLDGVLSAQQKEKGPVPDPPARRPIEWLDSVTMWAHAALGACLLLGLFSRLASFLLAMFLLSVTLIAPALPYTPTPPGAIGFYLFVNLYVIEMIALLALASMPTGRWFGVDALISYFTHRPVVVRPVMN
ncbi:MAG TPA: hypothetical protein VH120_06230, partial [Gemmataceae bacterium]|nr:hypothetical protein [Gemmataceae bacterium]